jgi:solute carrier family 25 (mitochondrial S-adenosylmethionine transporter), member 26
MTNNDNRTEAAGAATTSASTSSSPLHQNSIPAVAAVSFWTALVAGGMAGTAVDVALFPLDTLKTRLQAPQGFWQAGGVRGIYNGLLIVTAGSAPSAALFFATYETMKSTLRPFFQKQHEKETNHPALLHMAASSLGEIAACLVRVPVEVVKARMQTDATATLRDTITDLIQTRSLYRGFGITLFREIPFCCIQFPLYEYLKQNYAQVDGVDHPARAALCGSFAGAVAAAITTPLDVLKTRRMLGADQHGVPYKNVLDVWQRCSNADLWRGIQPRVFWISLGGYIFFGAYETSRSLLRPVLG